MVNTWFISDTHFDHLNVIKYCDRPYKDVDEMNEMLVKNWNETVAPDDIVFIVGDFSLSERALRFVARLNGTKILVSGNHDSTHPAHKKGKEKNIVATRGRYYEAGFNHIATHLTIGIAERTVNIAHLPYKGDTTDDRHEKYRLEDDGRVLLCGHVHEKWKTKFTPKGTLMVNVGVDVWDYKPVNVKVLEDLIRKEQPLN